MYDVLIIGGGPAGLTAGIYAARAGLNAAIFEKVYAGGQIAQTGLLENYPGFPDGISGMEFGAKLAEQAERFGASFVSAQVTNLDLSGRIKKIETLERTYETKALILSPGANSRKLGLAREAEFTGAGISYCATCDGAFFKGKDVAIVGGGDTSLEDSVYLAGVARKVYVIHRRDEFRAQEYLVERAKQEPNISFILNKIPVELLGGLDFEGVRLKDTITGATADLRIDGFFIAIGKMPDTEFLNGSIELTEDGYIPTGEDMHTQIPGVFAAGDARSKHLRQVVTAVADGAVAATEAYNYIKNNSF